MNIIELARKAWDDTVITQDQLRELFHYDPDTGLFTRLVSRGKGRVGDVARSLNFNGYVQIKINDKNYPAHRLAWLYVYGEFPREIDHINRIRHDNRLINLRSVTRKQNAENRSIFSNNNSGFKGVHLHKQSGRWKAQIRHNGVNIHIGLFDSPAQASHAYQKKASELFTHSRKEINNAA